MWKLCMVYYYSFKMCKWIIYIEWENWFGNLNVLLNCMYIGDNCFFLGI